MILNAFVFHLYQKTMVWYYIAFNNGIPNVSNTLKSTEQAKKTTGYRADPGRTCGVTFVQTDGTTHSSLIFPGGSTAGLLDALTRHLELKR